MLRATAVACVLAALPAQKGLVIVAVGDASARAGEGASAAWPQRVEQLCRGKPAVIGPVLLDRTAAGRTSRDVVELLADGGTGDVLALQLGGADALVEVDAGASEPRVARAAFAANLSGIVAGYGQRCAPLLITPSPLRWTPELRARYGRAPYDAGDERGLDVVLSTYAAEVRDLAARTGTPLVDVHRAFSRRDRFAGHAAADWLRDGLHPNDTGQQVIAHLVAHGVFAQRKLGLQPRPRPDYSIPVLDLSRQRHRQVIVDREAGQYLGHPTTVLLEDGSTMLAVYPKGHGRGAIQLKRSTDGGRTWSERLSTPASWATSKETPTIHRVVDAEGTRRLVLFSGLYPIRMAVSEDDGESWSELAPIGDYGGIVAMGCVIPTTTAGRYLALFHDDGRFIANAGRDAGPARFAVYQVESVDGGLTWSAPRSIASGAPHHCEPGFVRSPDGKTLAVLLRENSRRWNSHVIFSTDEGATWSAPRELPGALTGDRHVARYAPDGRLFVTFRDRTLVSPTWGDWVAWVGTWDDLVAGGEGQYRVRLMDNHKSADCAYPGLELLPDGTFVTTTYGHWRRGEEPYVASVRLRMEELDALASDPRELR